tara:strand:+ start:3130 stop:4206 length:1077 start_codon:yes stop_codon:yes gene_type:complete
MALFKKLFGKSEKENSSKGFHSLTVTKVSKIGRDTVKIEFSVPDNIKKDFAFIPGQYINFSIDIKGVNYRRSYSICSGPEEQLAVAVKKVKKGIISTWFNSEVQDGTQILASKPEGNFILPKNASKIVAIAAGSGITPIVSIAKSIEDTKGSLELFYGNRTSDGILFADEIQTLTKTNCTHFLSQEEKEGYRNGRIEKESFTNIIKSNLDILKSDVFFICGPEEMIVAINETLKLFGVAEDKIKFELFTTPVLMKKDGPTEDINFEGTSNVTVVVDSEATTFKLDAKKNILEKAIDEGVDAPYSCKGGVCSSCKGKVIEGDVFMKMNYTLTDSEVEEGYILCCQAFPRSEKVLISFDE